MPFYKRGFLYLMRKRGKSVLLLLIFLFVNSMILSTNMILHATESTEAAMQEKAGAKVVCEISDTANPITDKEAEMIKNLAEVTSINRMGQQSAYLTDLAPVTASASTEPDNLKVSLLSFDDMDTDSPFADQSYRLTDGELVKPETKYGAVINAGFAEYNGLQIGDTLSFETENGKAVTVEVIGEYLTGNESQQENNTLAVYRMENQIYIDNTAYLELFDGSGFYKVSAYTGQPELLDPLAESIQGILQDKADITTWIILPVVLGMLCTMLMYNENQYDMLKQLWIVPVNKMAYFFSKFAVVLVYSVCFMLITAAASILTGVLPGYIAFDSGSVLYLLRKCMEISLLTAFAVLPILAAAAAQKGYILPVCLTLVYTFLGFILLMVNMYLHPLSSMTAIVMRDIPGVVITQPLNIPGAFLCIGVWGVASVLLAGAALKKRK